MRQAPLGSQPFGSVENRMQQFVRMQRPLHQQRGFAAPHQRHRLLGGRMAVRCIDQPEPVEGNARFPRRLLDLSLRADQDRHDDAGIRRFHRGGNGRRAAGMGDGGDRRCAGRSFRHQRAEPLMPAHADVGQLDPGPADLLVRCTYAQSAGRHCPARFRAAVAGQDQFPRLGYPPGDGKRQDQSIASRDRPLKDKLLRQRHAARARQVRRHQQRHQSRNDRAGARPLAAAAPAGDHRQQIDILLHERTAQHRAVAGRDLVEGPVLHHVLAGGARSNVHESLVPARLWVAVGRAGACMAPALACNPSFSGPCLATCQQPQEPQRQSAGLFSA